MKIRTIILASLMLMPALAGAETIKSPSGNIEATITVENGKAYYAVKCNGKTFIEPSQLGFETSVGNFSEGLKLLGSKTESISETYTMDRIKTSNINYNANAITLNLSNADGKKMDVELRVSDCDIAYRYFIPKQDGFASFLITSEASSFKFPQTTKTYLCHLSEPMSGWCRTYPSYETEYKVEGAMTDKSEDGCGFSFPCLFRIGNNGWALVSETGVTSKYCASHLSDYQAEKGYTIEFPQEGQNNGFGSSFVSAHIPFYTPWRTITVGETLKPLVETTVSYDLVKPLYEPTEKYKPGRYTWSWIIWQDESMNYDDQVKFIDLAGRMGYEYILVDALWDANIGYDRMKDLSKYAQARGVNLMLWYNSCSGTDAPQTPWSCMNNSISRHKEMKWMKEIGVKGIKVDFFGGDKQETMKLYEDILVDANEYGLQVIFHGCTLPRGWERMYPNFVASEAVLASENVYFQQHHCDQEGFQLCMHPFCRNTVASMDWGGVMMNKRMSKDNNSRHYRRTSDLFEMASGITNQSFINAVAICPNNLTDVPQMEMDFLKTLPTRWDDTKYIDGYPSKYVILARRTGDTWYIAGLNGTSEVKELTLNLPMLAGKTVTAYTDLPAKKGALPECVKNQKEIGTNGTLKVTLQPLGGLILVGE